MFQFRFSFSNLPVFLRIIAFFAGLFCLSMIASAGFNLLNQKSDSSVVAGALILVILIAVVSLLMRKFATYLRKQFTSMGPGVLLLSTLGASPLLVGCYTAVEPGYVGIKVNMSGDNRGVEQLPVETGRIWYNIFTEAVFQYPIFIQSAIWTHNLEEGHPVNEEITFTTQDQMQVAADISLAYHISESKVPAFYVKFRNDDLEGFTHGFMRNLAREKFDGVAGRYRIEQIMGDNLPFLIEVRNTLEKALEPFGVELDQFGFVGAPRPPQSVIDAINAKVGAVQNAIRVENEVRQSEAEAKKSVAYAQGQAEANKLLANSISPQLLEWRRLAIQEKMVERWNGVRPTFEAGTGSGFIFQLPKDDRK